MRLSLAYEMQRPVVDDHAVIEETLEQCLFADEMGFDTLWFVEHHFLTSFSMSPCPEVMFGALSRLTKRIRLGFGVVILPYHHPVRVAERVAMVDHLSGGRVVLMGRAVLECPSPRGAPETAAEAAPAHLGRGAPAGDLSAGGREGHR